MKPVAPLANPGGPQCHSGRPWSPNTAVVKPFEVVIQLEQELKERGVSFIKGCAGWAARPESRELLLADGGLINYGHLINCSGLQADRVAYSFGVGHQYTLLPFKGLYCACAARFNPRVNLYPVPDLNVPFLGFTSPPVPIPVHWSASGPPQRRLGGGRIIGAFQAIEPAMAAANLALLAQQYFANRGGFRRYAHEQAFWLCRHLCRRLLNN